MKGLVMCKIALFPKLKRTLTENELQRIAKHMSSKDNDGFGYVATNGNKLYGERWLNVEDAFKNRYTVDASTRRLLSKYGSSTTSPEDVYSSFGGRRSKKNKALMLHARLATCGINIDNTHPFTLGQIAMVHNGVIHNSDAYLKKNKCDSLSILKRYTFREIENKPHELQTFVDDLDGYYACGFLSHKHMDILRDAKASLYVADIEAIGTVFATTADILIKIAEILDSDISQILSVNDNVMIRVNLEDESVKTYEFEGDAFGNYCFNSWTYNPTNKTYKSYKK